MSITGNQLIRAQLEETDDSGDQQLIKATGRKKEKLGGSVKIVNNTPFGFSSHAPKGSQGQLLFIGGNPDQAISLGFQHPQHRPTNLAGGETKLYDQFGGFIHLKDGKIHIKSAKIILEGTVYLGGEDADKEVSMKGTIDSAGHSDVSSLATKAFTK